MPVPDLVLVWRITEACDLGCPFCAYSRRLAPTRTHATANPGDVLRFGKLLSEYAQMHQRDVLVSWLGGEPLLWKPLLEVSHALKHDSGLRVSLTTNGTRLSDEAVRKQVVEDFDEITVSVDGVGSEHDRWRGTAGLCAQLENDVRWIQEQKLRRGRGPRIRVNTVLMRDTVHSFESLCLALVEWGVEELTFNALGGRDRPEFFPDHFLRPEDVRWLRDSLPGIRERMARSGLTILGGDRYLERLAASASHQPVPIADCQPGRSFLFVDERGMVAPCSFTTRGYGFHLSELCAPDDVHELAKRFAGRRRAEMLGPCYDCPSTQVFGKFSSESDAHDAERAD